jgi:hypothetical protein
MARRHLAAKQADAAAADDRQADAFCIPFHGFTPAMVSLYQLIAPRAPMRRAAR